MSNSTVNLTVDEASTNLTTFAFNEFDIIELNMFGVSFLFGLTNTYVIWLILTGAGNGIASEFFILNLSVCGLLFSLFSLLSFFTILFSQFPILRSSTNLLLGVAITGYPLFQCLICVERHVAVVYPVIFLKSKPLRYRVIGCSVAWIITLGSCLICTHSFLIFTKYSMYMWFLSMQFLLFLFVQMFCCLAVLRALKQSGPGEKGKEKVEENHMKRRAFFLILMTTVNTVITYAPLTMAALIFIMTQHLPQILWSVACICFTLTGFLPPVLYLHRLGKVSCPSICNSLA